MSKIVVHFQNNCVIFNTGFEDSSLFAVCSFQMCFILDASVFAVMAHLDKPWQLF